MYLTITLNTDTTNGVVKQQKGEKTVEYDNKTPVSVNFERYLGQDAAEKEYALNQLEALMATKLKNRKLEPYLAFYYSYFDESLHIDLKKYKILDDSVDHDGFDLTLSVSDILKKAVSTKTKPVHVVIDILAGVFEKKYVSNCDSEDEHDYQEPMSDTEFFRMTNPSMHGDV